LGNSRAANPERNFEYRGTKKQIFSEVSDFRIEQMLDKLIDNAVDFSQPGSTITIGLTAEVNDLTLFVTNHGPTIPLNMIDNVFDSMVSVRDTNPDNRLHFGIGLYVVRIIAEHHDGKASAVNLLNGNGVTIRVTLPLYKPVSIELQANT
jgi:signal transduction histidine kinase